MAKVPIYEKLGKMSPKKLSAEVGKRQINLERFEFATSDTIRSLSKLENEIKRVEKRIVNSLEKDNTAEALSDILQLRVLRVEEMVELSGLSQSCVQTDSTTSCILMWQKASKQASCMMKRASKGWFLMI